VADKPGLELGRALRDQVYEELERHADLLASYARSAGEAAFRGDQLTLGVHIKQARLAVLAMIKLYKDGLEHGQDLAEGGRSERRPGGDQPAGDGVRNDRSA